jgi:glycine cleavage system H protein
VTPDELLFNKTHEWVFVSEEDGSKFATIGISAFALEQLNDLVFIELPEMGRQVTAGEAFGEIESVKAVSDMYSPVDGEVVAVNSGLADQLETIGEDPYTAGWLVKIKITDETGLRDLMDFAAYEQQCAEEG